MAVDRPGAEGGRLGKDEKTEGRDCGNGNLVTYLRAVQRVGSVALYKFVVTAKRFRIEGS